MCFVAESTLKDRFTSNPLQKPKATYWSEDTTHNKYMILRRIHNSGPECTRVLKAGFSVGGYLPVRLLRWPSFFCCFLASTLINSVFVDLNFQYKHTHLWQRVDIIFFIHHAVNTTDTRCSFNVYVFNLVLCLIFIYFHRRHVGGACSRPGFEGGEKKSWMSLNGSH